MSAAAKKSKKSSAAKSHSLPERVVFFVDRSLGKHIVVDALRAAGAAVEAHDDHFEQDTPDVEWVDEVGRRGWVVLSKDARIRTRAIELESLKEARVHAFFLTRQDLVGEEMAVLFVSRLPKIRKLIARHTAPAVFTISRHGQIERVM